jgi:hypothetical protein
METQTIRIGARGATTSGQSYDHARPAEFVAEELGRVIHYGLSDNGRVTDTRGVTETLYKTEDGRLLVFVENWSRWQGEEDSARLVEITPEDLGPTGRFAELGARAGLGRRPLTLDEALEV